MSFETFNVRMFIGIIFILLSSYVNFGTPCCEEKERISIFLETAMDFISKAKSVNISCPAEYNFTIRKPQDCSDLYRNGYNKSGVYTIWPANRLTSMIGLRVYCDMYNGGWTVIQRRGDFGSPEEYFNQNWETFRKGFGDIERDFWLGNDNIFAITNQRQYSVYFDLKDKQQNKAYAHYDNFWIDDEFNNYTLHISGYGGTAGDSMRKHDTMKFTTKDRDNDIWKDGNCAVRDKSGYWFHNCATANLNGKYTDSGAGFYWKLWKKSSDILPHTEIKIKSSIF